MHYAAIGVETTDRTRVGLQFYPKGVEPERKLISAHVGDDEDLDIPAGASNVRHDGYYRLRENAHITAFQAHLHNLGKRQCLEAILPDNRKEILSCADWDFGWHIVYNYEDDVAPLLPKGTLLHVTSWHDNSEANLLERRPDQLGRLRPAVERRDELRLGELVRARRRGVRERSRGA